MLAKFFGGSRDGKTLYVEHGATRVLVPIQTRRYDENGDRVYDCETYVRDRANYERAESGEILVLAYKLEAP